MGRFKISMSWEVQVSTEVDAENIDQAKEIAYHLHYPNKKWKIEHTEWHYAGSVEKVVNGKIVSNSYQRL